jgi:predicted Zn-dependent protease
MNYHGRINIVRLCTLLLPLLLSACDNRQEKAQSAYIEYQSALVRGDLRSARKALESLVAADDSNADYWVEMGKVAMQLSDYGAAYDAYQRAHELDRANVEVLAIMTQLALRSGNLVAAEQNARQLELVAPTNPAVPLTKGYVALRRADLVEAERQAGIFTELSPYDSSGKVLQARIFMARGQPDSAVDLLRKQIAQQPSDAMSLRAIASIFELKEQWVDAAWALRNYLSWQPNDEDARARLVEFELRSGRIQAAEAATIGGLEKNDVDALLAPWVALGLQNAIADRVFLWAQTAQVGRRIAVARFLATVPQPRRVLSLIGREAALPVTPANVIPNALYGAALAQVGRTSEGLARLNDVLLLDGTVKEALRARAQLRSEAGSHRQAIEDAQKLVAADRSSSLARLFLAQLYVTAGDAEGARRTLWDAFHDIAGDRSIYEALRPLVMRLDGSQAAQRLSQEFYDQRNESITRSFA